MKEIKRSVAAAHAGRKPGFVNALQTRAIKKQFPWSRSGYKIKEFMAKEDLWVELAVKHRLGKNLQSPQNKSRGVHLSALNRTHGHHAGAGYRKSGAGRKNKFEKIWNRVKV